MGKFKSLSGKDKGRLIVSIVSLPVIVAAGVALGIGNHWAFVDGASTLTTYLTAPVPQDAAAMTRSAPGMGDELAVEVEGEGIVMLENNGTLPLNKNDVTQVNVFGHGSVDWYIMSSGSEMVGTKGHKSYDFNSALRKKGIKTNEDISNYYTDWHKAEGDSNTIQSHLDNYFVIREPSLEVDDKYKEIYDDALSYSDTAFFVISRHAGENSDCPHYQNKLESNNSTHKSGNKIQDMNRTYLEISEEEEYTLRQVAADFENVIVIVNSTNNMTLDFVKKINDKIPDGIDAVLNVGVTGGQGALAIPDVVFGDVTPSGHMTDTTPYRPEYNITYYRSCAKHTRHYEGGKSSDFFSKAGRGSGGSAFYQYACYSEYTEGIYMGYRWFETADAEGFWDQDPYNGYENVVQYPFGYGMSYTDFEWKFVEASKVNGARIEADEKLNLKVEVTNTGEYKGKDVVQIYLTAPYTPGGIEKSFRKLVGYEKTPLLQPGDSCVIDIEVDTKDFKSYDDYDANNNDHTGYELEKGDYELNFMTDAHNVKDGMAPMIYKVFDDLMIDKDEVTG
jgi:beta-glucosidase